MENIDKGLPRDLFKKFSLENLKVAYSQLLNLIRLMKKNKNIFKNKKIIVTGHTGFKGSWLVAWLILLGAKVTGISNNIPTNPSHFKYLKFKNKIDNYKLDIRNLRKLKKIFKLKKPDYVFHLAAQSLVKKSFSNPILTWQTNTIGTLNVLEASKKARVKKLIYAASASCYGIPKKYPTNVVGFHKGALVN